MAYTALYRKWRPAYFADVKGQDAIVTTLKNQILMNRIGHAYLFCGTRGTGKTTVAKIFARAVNCEHPRDGEPCGECASCQAIAAGTAMNVAEIDAASNNSVDNIREIREEVQYPPSEGKYRVYIIDEVHMLSAGAFNALLKTLEEPPPYVIFILATTEPQKIPATVLSRCQRYDFRRISLDVLVERLKELTEYEHVTVEDKALRYIAGKADGAMRDAISLLDQCIAFHIGEDLTYEMVLSVLGAADNEIFSRFLRGILNQDVSGCLAIIDDLFVEGREPGQFVQDFIWYMRDLLLLISSDVDGERLDLTREDWERLRTEAQMTTPSGLMRLIRIFSDLYNQMRGAVNRRVLLEVAVIRTAEPEMEENYESLEERICRLERKVEEGIFPVPGNGAESAAPKPEEERKEEEDPSISELPEAGYPDLMAVQRDWKKIVGRLEGGARGFLKGTSVEPAGRGVLRVVFPDPYSMSECSACEGLEQLKPLVEQACGRQVRLEARAGQPGESEPEYPLRKEEVSRIFGVKVEDEDDDDEDIL